MKQSVSYPIWFYVSYVNVSCALLGGCFILFHREMFPECAVDVVKFWTPVSLKTAQTNSADPDQTASKEAVWSGSSLFVIPTSILLIQDTIWEEKE